MNASKVGKTVLEDQKVNVKTKLSALWASVMFCYVYGDYFGLYGNGKLAEMMEGKIGPLGEATQGVLVGVSAMMAVPSVMVFLSLAMPPVLNRWLNLLLGLAYTAIMLMTMRGAPTFYIFMGVIEVLLTLLIVWHAWTWPRRQTP
ncbi:DUF6326 family protein [Pseudoxanthomonas sp. CF125]|uniref:DUF6326 family protein n=1 Tax=Pseudoxanthomonas sp. CF125 TaxID=1855303 RepID=UPI00087F31A3|nr:DUF6326 family protein [Pseudoxanthomonas sp. CF125]SDQ85891.1 hypothetical protein SAMN05216569_2329 [Pseudoxanthomonas sp. CF125]